MFSHFQRSHNCFFLTYKLAFSAKKFVPQILIFSNFPFVLNFYKLKQDLTLIPQRACADLPGRKDKKKQAKQLVLYLFIMIYWNLQTENKA